MANELKNTLPPLPPRNSASTSLTGDNQKDIASLEKGTGNVESFSSALRGVTDRAYAKRQESDLARVEKQIDPTKVSGGLFASIVGAAEGRRGMDVSKTHRASQEAFDKSEARKERLAAELRAEEEKKRERERQDRIRQEEYDKELKNQAALMGVTDLSGSSEDIQLRIASKVKAKQDATKNANAGLQKMYNEMKGLKEENALSLEEQAKQFEEQLEALLGIKPETTIPDLMRKSTVTEKERQGISEEQGLDMNIPGVSDLAASRALEERKSDSGQGDLLGF